MKDPLVGQNNLRMVLILIKMKIKLTDQYIGQNIFHNVEYGTRQQWF